jgi:hypothetical protein
MYYLNINFHNSYVATWKSFKLDSNYLDLRRAYAENRIIFKSKIDNSKSDSIRYDLTMRHFN